MKRRVVNFSLGFAMGVSVMLFAGHVLMYVVTKNSEYINNGNVVFWWFIVLAILIHVMDNNEA